MLQQDVKEIRDLIADVKYPGTSKTLISLDMIQGIKIDGDVVSFRLVFQKSTDPFVNSVKKKCEKILLESNVCKEVKIETVFVHDLERPTSLEKVNKIIAISSGKGGVGKSTVATNLAVALAVQGYKVGLIDADIFGPSQPKMFQCEGERPVMVNVDGRDMIEPIEKYGVKLLSIGFFVDPETATVWRGPMASNALKQMIEEGHWGELDYMLIDLPPGTSDIHLTIVQTIALSGAIVVSTPQQVALADAIKGIGMFESPSVGVPVIGLIENMSWFTPAELPENKYYIFGKEGCKKLSEERGMNLLGQIPMIQSICESGDKGLPVALDPNSITGKAFGEVACKLQDVINDSNITAKRVKIKE